MLWVGNGEGETYEDTARHLGISRLLIRLSISAFQTEGGIVLESGEIVESY
jgi:hypothetical protein